MLLNIIVFLVIFLYLLCGLPLAIKNVSKTNQQDSNAYELVFIFYFTLLFYPFMLSTWKEVLNENRIK